MKTLFAENRVAESTGIQPRVGAVPSIRLLYGLLMAVFIVSLSLRLWWVDQRWINPDEGAHLMDAVLVLDGKIPDVDYSSRQPLYVYVIVGFLKVFGVDYVSGRMMPIFCSVAIGGVVFLLARELFDSVTATLAAVVYWMLPIELLNSMIVKTEPLVTLLECLSIYGVVRAWKGGGSGYLVLAGVMGGMAYYVRQSSLIVPAVVVVFLLMANLRRPAVLARELILFGAGYAGVVAAVLTLYMRVAEPTKVLLGNLSPIGFLLGSAKPVVTPVAASVRLKGMSHDWSMFIGYIKEGLLLHLFLFVGLGIAVAFIARELSRGTPERRRHATAVGILFLWVAVLALAYTYYLFTRGFFIDYVREFLPPLAIGFAAGLRMLFPDTVSERRLGLFIFAGLALLGLVFWLQSLGRDMFGYGFHTEWAVALFLLLRCTPGIPPGRRRSLYVGVFVVLTGVALFSHSWPLRSLLSGMVPSIALLVLTVSVAWFFLGTTGRREVGGMGTVLAGALLFASTVIGTAYAGTVMDRTYDSIWSPEAVRAAADYLKAHTRPGDEVISGAVIWELQGLRRPFNMVSHPLSFMRDLPENEKEDLRLALATRPPKVIILDGYTEKTYFRQVPSIRELLQARYELATTVEPANYPVLIYILKEQSALRRPAE